MSLDSWREFVLEAMADPDKLNLVILWLEEQEVAKVQLCQEFGFRHTMSWPELADAIEERINKIEAF